MGKTGRHTFHFADGTESVVHLERRGGVLLGIQEPNDDYPHWGAGVLSEKPMSGGGTEYVILDIDKTDYKTEAEARKSGEAMLAKRTQ